MKYSITKILNFGAGIYSKWVERNLGAVYNKIIELADLNGNEKTLDIGCGSGKLDLMIAKILDKGLIYGIDAAPKMIEIAKRKAKEESYKIDYKIGNSSKLPYENNEFDIVLTCLMFHHLNYEEKSQTIKEIFRILKQNGRYICFEFGKFPGDIFHKTFLKLSSRNSGLIHGLYPAELIEKNGFYIEKQIEGPSFWKHHHTIYRILKKYDK